ncbi:MAG: Eco57I restriction-modification methylase domain-containing protein [Gammaproteobacteria bacterium]
MRARIQELLNTQRLAENLTPLFCEILRWGASKGMARRTLEIGAPVGTSLTAVPVTKLSGLPVLRLDWPEDRPPTVTARRAVQRALAPVHAEHLLCYVTRDRRQAAFVWARQRTDGKTELRTLPYEVGSPARTTIDRLSELAFRLDELGATGQPPITAVTDKLNAAFSVEEVTKQFYQDIAKWYFWALDYARFPKDAPKQDGKDHVSLIRLITRVIFGWFLKGKGLVPGVLFDPRSLALILDGFGPDKASDKSSVFYKAILQNLFFATLNTEMDKRAWARDEQNFMAHSLFRHRELFRDPGAALDLFKDIPFLNGGLFECLDRIEGTREKPRYIRIDGFSRRADSQPVVPDFLFFGEERTVDLSQAYGKAGYRSARVRGLVQTLASYNFTLAENTPLDQEVALDPELLGKVFENLLAAHNPETRTTARKQSGSYYTPREIVDYMVDEALIAGLRSGLAAALPEAPDIEARLRHLFAYDEESHRFTESEVEALIHAIDHLKILDPACGSGAFPMGILHKLVFVLGKLDPGNKRWKARQLAKAAEIPDAVVRERVLADIEQTFTANELDYGRKLYLIENCIYGVDIQPIAVQIAKLRFFISLVVDQKVNRVVDNLGIRALPNLETKFVAANTLIGINRPAQLAFRNTRIEELERELARVRESHFLARTPATKAKHRERDAALRAEIAELLKEDGWDSATARMLAAWDPYDQNASAGFFDAEWMFGQTDGFDVVIGNPPYVRIQTLNETAPRLVRYLKDHYAAAKKGNYDLYVVFVEAGLKLLSPQGELAYILHKFFNAQYGETLRKLLSGGRHLRHVVHFGDQQIFPGATNYVCLLFLAKAGAEQCRWVRADNLVEWLVTLRASEAALPAERMSAAEWNFAVGLGSGLFDKLRRMPVKLGDVAANLFQGLVTSADDVYLLEPLGKERSGLVRVHSNATDKDYELETAVVKLLCKGALDVRRYSVQASKRVLFPYDVNASAQSSKTTLVPSETFSKLYPRTWDYLEENKQLLRNRESGKMRHNGWYGYVYPKSIGLFACPKILTPSIAAAASYACDPHGDFYFVGSGGGGGGGYGVTVCNGSRLELSYVLALLNSRLLDWVHHRISTPFRGGYFAYGRQFIAQLPIRPIDFGSASDCAEHDAIVSLVQGVLSAKRADPAADTWAFEREIDERVYRLYGLTLDEIQIVEESAPTPSANVSNTQNFNDLQGICRSDIEK